MAASNTSTNYTELDFLQLKNSLINHLKSQAIFKDYDFSGSDLSVLVDLLTKNTEKNAFYYNMLFSEAFLDSAQMKSSVFSHSKDLNYTPRSRRSARARIRVDFEATGDNQPYIVQKGRSFNTLIKNEAYIFTIPETLIVASANTSFSFETDIYEGVYLKDAYVFQSDEIDPYPRFKITNQNVDTTSLTVAVFEDGSDVADNYRLTTSLLGLDDTSKVYFLQTSEDGFYEVLFGDGVVGRTPKNGSTIVLDYRVSNAIKPNGAGVFSINFDPTGAETELTESPTITTLEPGQGGAETESIESVRYYAPRAFQVQERAVVPSDYAILLKTNFPEINAVDVYGGEEENPPLFGKVIVSVDISNVEGLPESKKKEYYDFLRSRCPLSITPIFKEPLFTFLRVESLVRYNVNISPASKERIKTLVTDTIATYNQKYLDDFAVTLRYSNLVRQIDATDSSIVSNITAVSLYKKTTPTVGVPQSMTLDFGVGLASTSETTQVFNESSVVSSTMFTYKGELMTLRDDGLGNLYIVKRSGTSYMPVITVGKVDYINGVVELSNFNIDDYDGDFLKVYVRPSDPDVSAIRRNILTIESDEIKVDVEALRI